jgi:hypothetical protein
LLGQNLTLPFSVCIKGVTSAISTTMATEEGLNLPASGSGARSGDRMPFRAARPIVQPSCSRAADVQYQSSGGAGSITPLPGNNGIKFTLSFYTLAGWVALGWL